jgi:glycosyltransferase involved in cell wall biosynthesis
MRVILNFSGLRSGGGRTDAINLIYSLPRVKPDWEFTALVPKDCGYENVETVNCSIIYVPYYTPNSLWRLFYDNVIIPYLCKTVGAEVLFTMCNNGPVAVSCEHFVMIRRPQLAYPVAELERAKVRYSFKYRFLRWYFGLSAKNTAGIIAQTATMKRLVEKTYAPPCPVYVVGKTISAKLETAKSPAEERVASLRRRIGESRAAFKFLYLTKYYPHKNIEAACDAMMTARERGIDVALVLTLDPSESEACSVLLRRVEEGRYGEAVVNIGTVDLPDIELVYNSVSGVFMPTLLESYSATFVEAMAFKKILLVSDRAFAREICGNAAIYMDPLSVDSMIQALETATKSIDLSKEKIAIGSKLFAERTESWAEIAEKYAEILSQSKKGLN